MRKTTSQAISERKHGTKAAPSATPRFIAIREWFMKPKHMPISCAAFLLALLLCLGVPATAQEPDRPTEGINSGNYNIKQTIEFGYRFSDTNTNNFVKGNQAVYGTFVNLRSGLRLFEHTLEMRSLNHRGWLFDDFFATSFGYGGDPNDVTRLRAYKNQWFNFSGTFRRDRNFWDYNLLANPLNPARAVTNAPAGFSPVVTSSPHTFQVTRRMSDFNLTLLPQSRVRFRLGYSRNISEGPAFSTLHAGTDILLFQGWKTTVNSYQAGIDFKLLPRTNISYDQFLFYYKGDTTWADRNLTFQLANGTPADLGLPFNTPANMPCAAPFVATPPGSVNPSCNGYLQYNRAGRARTSYPTEQLTFQSNYFKDIDFSGRLMYSSADSDVPDFNEFFQGLVTRTIQREFAVSGPANVKRVSASADFGVTWHISSKFRIVDMFRFANFRIPGLWRFGQCSLFGTSMLVVPNFFGSARPTNCPTTGSSATPPHNNSSPADVISGTSSLFLGQNLKNNHFELEYDLNKHMGGLLGYRFRHRRIVHADTELQDLLFFPALANRPAPPPPTNVPVCPPANNLPNGSCAVSTSASDSDQTETNEHSLLFGVWSRPIDALQLNFDLELMSADNTLTRISPRQLQHYKLRATYKPSTWATFGASLNILENRDNVLQVNNLQHNRSYGFSAVIEPNAKFGLDFGYDYNGIFSQTNICYSLGFGPLPKGSTPCPSGPVPAPIQALSFYNNKVHFGYFNLLWQPIKHVSTRLGYNLTSTSGDTLILTPNAPGGPLAFNYHRPTLGLAFDLWKRVTWKLDWNYYDYKEKTVPDPTGPRNFRANLVTMAFRYAF